jgi:hypothetical protein
LNGAWRNFKFTTNLVHNDDEGWSALGLHRRLATESKVVARIVFRDSQTDTSIDRDKKKAPRTQMILGASESDPTGN